MITAGAEDGTNGATVAVTDPGNATPFQVVTVGSGAPVAAALIYDTTRAQTGTKSFKATSGSTGQLAQATWDNTVHGTLTDHYSRVCLYLTGNPATAWIPCFHDMGGSGANCGRFQIGTDGKIRLLDTTGATVATSTGTVALNQWIRVEIHLTHGSGAVGSITVRYYSDATSTTITETISASSVDTALNAQRFRAIRNDVNPTMSAWFDNAAAAETAGWIGPASNPAKSLVYADYRVRRNTLLRRCGIFVPRLWLPRPVPRMEGAPA